MSIWCSWSDIGYEELDLTHAAEAGIETGVIDENGIRPPVAHLARGEVRSYASGFSNHYPTTDGGMERPASVGISHIPVWCVPGHREETDDSYGEWLRLSVYTAEHDWHHPENITGYTAADVVMDEAAVRALVADLTEWLEQPKAHPVDALLGEHEGTNQ